MKKTMLKLMRISGTFATFRMANRNKALILMYHRFSELEDRWAISAAAFQEHLKYLTTHYRVVPLSQIAGHIARGTSLPPGLAAITIDDGYYDTYAIALPLLHRYNVPATLFVITDFIEEKAWVWTDKLKYLLSRTKAKAVEVHLDDSTTRIELGDPESRRDAAAHINSLLKAQPNETKEQTIPKIAESLDVALPVLPPEEFRPLTWDEVQALDAAGVEIGSHTVTHPILTRVNDEQLRYELYESKLHLEARLRKSVGLFCYPNGNYDGRIVREVRRAGYECAVTTDYGLSDRKSDLLRLQRISADNDLPHFMQSTSGFEEAKIRLRSMRFATGFTTVGRQAIEGLRMKWR